MEEPADSIDARSLSGAQASGSLCAFDDVAGIGQRRK